MKTTAQVENKTNTLKAGLANQMTIDALKLLKEDFEKKLLMSAPVASDPNGFWAHNGLGRVQAIDYVIRLAESYLKNDKKK